MHAAGMHEAGLLAGPRLRFRVDSV
jgi:hypothetical protein